MRFHAQFVEAKPNAKLMLQPHFFSFSDIAKSKRKKDHEYNQASVCSFETERSLLHNTTHPREKEDIYTGPVIYQLALSLVLKHICFSKEHVCAYMPLVRRNEGEGATEESRDR